MAPDKRQYKTPNEIWRVDQGTSYVGMTVRKVVLKQRSYSWEDDTIPVTRPPELWGLMTVVRVLSEQCFPPAGNSSFTDTWK